MNEILALQAVPDPTADQDAPGQAITGLTSYISVDNNCSTICSVACPGW